MKKKKKIVINLSDKLFYTLAVLGILIFASLGVYAFGGSTPTIMGHSVGEIDWSGVIQKIKTNELCLGDNCKTDWPEAEGFSGGTLFYFNNDHLGRILKNGASAEAICSTSTSGYIPHNYRVIGKSRIENGQIKTIAEIEYKGSIVCSEENIGVVSPECIEEDERLKIKARSTFDGIELEIYTKSFSGWYLKELSGCPIGNWE